MPFNIDPNHYIPDPAGFSQKAKSVVAEMQSPNTTKIKIGDMSVGNGMFYVLYFHRKVGLVCVVKLGEDSEFGYQGLTDENISINKMLLYLDNIGQPDTGDDVIPEMQLVRGHMFGVFQGTADEMQAAMAGVGQGQMNIPNRMFIAADASQLPRFDIDFFDAVLARIQEASNTGANYDRR